MVEDCVKSKEAVNKKDKIMIKQFSTLLLSLIISLTIVTYATACGCCNKSDNSVSIQQSVGEQLTEEKVQCPVMKTWILPSEAADSAEYNGKTYYFCCGGCKEQFLQNPDTYISAETKS